MRRSSTVPTSRLRLTAVTVGLLALLLGPPAIAAGSAVRANAVTPTQSVLQELNALRKRQGLSLAHLTNDYKADVTNAALRNGDPALGAFTPGALVEYGLWGISTDPASVAPDPRIIVDDWVYRDGWRGPGTQNVECTSPTAPGCNGHRRAVLSSAPHPGDKLAVDVAVHEANWEGAPAISVAMIMVWSESPAARAPGTVVRLSLAGRRPH
jgi:hypothetical protein